jgi:molybdate transport system substrate-binding protein
MSRDTSQLGKAVAARFAKARTVALTAITLLLLLVIGCGQSDAAGTEDDGEQVTIVVSAASDLRFAFAELADAFERETGIRVTFNFGSTGQLAQQIEQGAPVDVFAAANVSFLDDLAQGGHIIPDTQAPYARGFIVLWTRDDSQLQFNSIEDAAQPGVRRIAIANPDHAPYGIAAREAFQSAGMWETVQPKLVLGENVSQALQFAQTSNVDVALVALSLAVAPSVAGGRYELIPQELHGPIDQALGVVSSTRHESEARAFAEFVNGPIGRPVMDGFGFALPGEAR